jgi:hypothetical protein
MGQSCPDRSSESLKKGALLMSEAINNCVLVAPGHNLPAEINPKKAKPLDVQRVRSLASGVLELGYCECPKEMRFMPDSPWSSSERCPHLVITHCEELLDAVRDGRVKSLVTKDLEYGSGVLVWSVELRAHFWLRKLEPQKLINDYQIILQNFLNFLNFQQPTFEELPKRRAIHKSFLGTAPQRFRRFVFERFHKNTPRFLNVEANSTFEIEANSPCFHVNEESK